MELADEATTMWELKTMLNARHTRDPALADAVQCYANRIYEIELQIAAEEEAKRIQ